jgi:hypothetical protein
VSWLLVCAVVAVSVTALWAAIGRVRRELGPTYDALDTFGRDVRPAVLRVQAETRRTRSHLPAE